MTFYRRLIEETAVDAAAFRSIPLIRRVLADGADRATYLDFLSQAYHHVRQTCPLLALALSRLEPHRAAYRHALLAYLDEEKGHEDWILDDIAALGGDAEAVRSGEGRLPCRAMVSHAWHLTDRVDAHCLLGMVHVLEGQSAALAQRAADAIAGRLAVGTGRGFTYLCSHGGLDQEHVQMFADLLDGLDEAAAQARIVAAARDFYALYGAMLDDIDRHEAARHGA